MKMLIYRYQFSASKTVSKNNPGSGQVRWTASGSARFEYTDPWLGNTYAVTVPIIKGTGFNVADY